MSKFKTQEGTKLLFCPSSFKVHGCVYSIVNTREFMSWLTFT